MFETIQRNSIYLFWLLIILITLNFSSIEGNLNDILIQLCIGITLFILIFGYTELSKILKLYCWCVLIFLSYLVFKSELLFNTTFIYPNVFKRIIILLLIPAAFLTGKLIYKKGWKIFFTIFYFGLLFKLIVFRDISSFQWGSDYRIINAEVASVFLIPYFLNLNAFLRKEKSLLWSLFFLAIIFLAQHRTIWICSVIGTFLILLNYVKRLVSLLPVLSIIIIFILITVPIFYSIIDVKLLEKISVQVEDIFNPTEQGTGSWRYEQSLFYLERIKEKIILGWDFEAYEMGEVMAPGAWAEEKGTHIHNGFIDSLYYFGVIGLLLNYILFFYAGSFYKKYKLLKAPIQPITVFFIISFVYSLSYILPIYFYPLCGLAIFLINKSLHELTQTHLVSEDVNFPLNEEYVKR